MKTSDHLKSLFTNLVFNMGSLIIQKQFKTPKKQHSKFPQPHSFPYLIYELQN